MSVTGELKFLGFIEEDDGSLTMECVDEAGVRHEFLGSVLQDIKVAGVEGKRIDMVMTVIPVAEKEPKR